MIGSSGGELKGTILKPGGRLVIADADPANLSTQPLYGIALGKRQIALRLRPIDPVRLEATAIGAGLELAERRPAIVKRDGSAYAFVAVKIKFLEFRKPAQHSGALIEGACAKKVEFTKFGEPRQMLQSLIGDVGGSPLPLYPVDPGDHILVSSPQSGQASVSIAQIRPT